MYRAAERGHFDVVRLLLEAGADKDAANGMGAAALCRAAERGHFEVVRLLLEAGADKDRRTSSTPRSTGLSFIETEHAVWFGDLAVPHRLLAGADEDAADADGAMALHVAAQHNHVEVVRLLLEAGADKDAENAFGATALSIAAEEGHLDVFRLLQEAGAQSTLLQLDKLLPPFVWSRLIKPEGCAFAVVQAAARRRGICNARPAKKMSAPRH